MKCNFCGNELNAQERFCSACGAEQNFDLLSRASDTYHFESIRVKNNIASPSKLIRNIGFIVIGLALIISCLYTRARWAGSANYGSAQAAAEAMGNIASISGNTIDEAFYQDMGKILYDYTSIIIDVGLSTYRTWLLANRLSLFGGLVLINIGFSGLFVKRKTRT